jgi:hypothetical protein
MNHGKHVTPEEVSTNLLPNYLEGKVKANTLVVFA